MKNRQFYTYANNAPIDLTFILHTDIQDAIAINASNYQVPIDAVVADVSLPKLKTGEIYIVEFTEAVNLTVSKNVKAVKNWQNITVYHKETQSEMKWNKVLLSDTYTDQKPTSNYQKWDEKLQKWLDDESKLDELKSIKKAAINEARTNAELSGFWFNDKEFDSDRDSISRIGNAATAAQSAILMKQEFTVNWVTKGNSTMQLDASGVLMMHGALVQHVDAANAKSQLLKKRVDAAKTIAELETIQWEE